MTVAALASSTDYAGNGVTLSFTAPFRFLEGSDIAVTLTAADGTQTVPVYGVDYSVSGGETDAGGTVTFVVAPAAGVSINIRRETARAQESDYLTNDTFPSSTLEDDVDELQLIVQEIDREVDRGPRFPRGAATYDLEDFGDAAETELVMFRDGGLKRSLWSGAAGLFATFSSDGRRLIGVAGTFPSDVAAVLDNITADDGGTAQNAISMGSTVTDLLADTAASLPVGSYVRSGSGHVFKVADPSATDHGVTTAGGVKLYPIAKAGTLNAAQFGAVGDGATDDTAALNAGIAYAIANKLPFVASAPEYKLTGTVTIGTNGNNGYPGDSTLQDRADIRWGRSTVLKQYSDNTTTLIVSGSNIRMSDIRVTYDSFQDNTNASSIGVLFRNLSFANIGFVDVRYAAVGIVTNGYIGGTSDFFFDNVIEGLRVIRFSIQGIAIVPFNHGNTPNVIHSMSAIAPYVDGTAGWFANDPAPSGPSQLQQGLTGAIKIKGCRGMVIGKMNVETLATGAASTTGGIYFDDCHGLRIGALHIEKVAIARAAGNFINIYQSQVSIGALTLYNFDMGYTAGVNGTSVIVCTSSDAFFEIGLVEMQAYFEHPASCRFLTSSSSANRVQRFVDGVDYNNQVAGNTGTFFVDANGHPTTSWTGAAGPRIPAINYWNGVNLTTRCRLTYAAGATKAAGLVAFDTTTISVGSPFSAGTFTAPIKGSYEFNASMIADAAASATFNFKVNGVIKKRWSHDNTAGSTAAPVGNFGGETLVQDLNAGDTVTFNIESGTGHTNPSFCWFEGALLSR